MLWLVRLEKTLPLIRLLLIVVALALSSALPANAEKVGTIPRAGLNYASVYVAEAAV